MRVLLTMSYNNIMLNNPCLPCGLYSISAQNSYGKSSCWPWQHPGESPSYILHEDKIQNTRERPSVKFAKLSVNHIVGLVYTHRIINEV